MIERSKLKQALREHRLSRGLYRFLGYTKDSLKLVSNRLRFARSFPAGYFDDLFARKHDPWAFRGNAIPEERRKRIIGLLKKRRYHCLLEIGCAEGWMTPALAEIADELVSVDISSVALERARTQCIGIGNVTFLQMDVMTDQLPTGPFDCILCAGVLVFIAMDAQNDVCRRITAGLRCGGDLLLEHTREASLGEVPGRVVHALYRSRVELKEIHHQDVENYAITMFCKVNP